MLALMILNFLASIVLIIMGFIFINPESAIVKTGYSDISGYHDGVWTDMLAFPLLGLILGVLHNIIAVNVFYKRGAGMAKFFLIATTALIAGGIIVLIRLSGEG